MVKEIQSRFDKKPLSRQTMGNILKNRAEHLVDQPYIFYGPEEKTVSFDEINEKANSIGNSLLNTGIEKQGKVSVMMRNPLQTLFAMFGINKAGCVYSPINFEYKGQVLSYQINDTDPDILIIEDQYVERLNEIKGNLERAPEVIVHETDSDAEELDRDFESFSFQNLLEGDSTNPDVDVSWNDKASIVYTSGTTGKPKGVVLPYSWIFANYTLAFGQILNEEDVTHTSLPLYHIGGLYADVTSALVSGSSIAVWDRFSPTKFWDRVEKYQATKVILLSVMIPWLMEQPEEENDHENTLNKVYVQPLPENYEEISKRFGFNLALVGFAQTESGVPLGGVIREPCGERKTPDDLYRGTPTEKVIEITKKLGLPVVDEAPANRFLGKPVQHATVAVLDENDEKLPAGETGELAVRPEKPGILMKEYYEKPEKTVEAFQNLWFHTGDAAYYDEDGNFFFVDRIGDVIRRRGENISSIQIQDVINSHEEVAKSAVFPVTAEEGGEDEIGAALELKGDSELSKEDLLEYLESELPGFMVPEHLTIVEQIPTTETRKMEKYKLRKDLEEEL